MSRSPTRKIGRNTKSGQPVSAREMKDGPRTTRRERIPSPEHGAMHRTKDDTIGAAREAVRYRDSNSGRFVPVRDRYPSKSSADRIPDTSEKAADSLRRHAKR